jgi:hypothetical protein
MLRERKGGTANFMRNTRFVEFGGKIFEWRFYKRERKFKVRGRGGRHAVRPI